MRKPCEEFTVSPPCRIKVGSRDEELVRAQKASRSTSARAPPTPGGGEHTIPKLGRAQRLSVV